MLTRIWPYGTRKRVYILDVIESGRHRVVVCDHLDDDPRESTMLFCRPGDNAAVVGESRVMEFREGGPTGGHWALIAAGSEGA